MKLVFYTTIKQIDLPENVFPIVPYHVFRKRREKLLVKYTRGIVDAGVYQLKKYGEYPYLHEYPLSLPDGWEWVIPDYPSDMRVFPPEKCIELTKRHVEQWITCKGALPVIQFRHMDFENFKQEYSEFMEKYHHPRRYAIGNLCRLVKAGEEFSFLKRVLHYVVSHANKEDSFHIFGCCLRGVRYLCELHPPNVITFDSTKWTRAPTSYAKKITCNLKTREKRQVFLHEYVRLIQDSMFHGKTQLHFF